MKFKTRLQITFFTIVLLPLVLTAVAFIVIGIYLMNMQQGYPVKELSVLLGRRASTLQTQLATGRRLLKEKIGTESGGENERKAGGTTETHDRTDGTGR